MTDHRALVDFLKRAYSGAFSRGLGYEPMAAGQLYERDRVAGYYIDYSSKTTVDVRPYGELTPANLAQLVLGWHEQFLSSDAGLDRAVSAGRYLLASAERHDASMLWPYQMEVSKYGTKPPWYSGFAQSQIASALIRLWLATDEEMYAEGARGAIEPLLTGDDPRFVTHTSLGPILEEISASPPAHILNGWVFSLFGLKDVGIAFSEPRAVSLFEQSTECLTVLLPDYDVGWWTRYSLFPHAMPDLAKPIYQRLHADLMAVMYDLTHIEQFSATATRWRSYDTPVRRSVAVLSKLPFVAFEARQRQRQQLDG